MSLKEEKHLVLQELINIMNQGLADEGKLTSELLIELKGKIDGMIEKDF
jgi:hypothetical protein